jgi:protein-disulfide isomerase
MRRLSILFLALALTLSATAQTLHQQPVTPAPPPAGRHAAGEGVPSRATVESFLQHMFGFNPALKWQIISIAPSEELPGFGEVLVGLGQSAAKLYITPDGKHAIQGEVMPFGADPFAEARAQLAKASGPSRGPADAPVTIVEFSDLECPHCAKAQPVLEKLLADEPNTRVIYESFPLPQHKWAARAAAFALCIDREDKTGFWKFVDSVYQNQLTIDDTNFEAKLTELATAAGASGPQAAACASTPAIQERIEKSIALGREVGISGTPTFFINGRKVMDIVDTPYEQVKAVVEYAAKQGTGGGK